MEYGYKITSHGQAVTAACLDMGVPLKLTRAAVGSGAVAEGTSLSEVHTLIHFVSDAAITGRDHQGNLLHLTVQYSNQSYPEISAFTLSEFMVFCQDPETGQETDFLYATLGDYRQPVPSFRSGFPASVWTFPVVLTVSGELQVNITASPGLVTSLDLQDAIDRLKLEIMTNELTLPLTADTGKALLTSSGTPLLAVYHPNQCGGILTELAALEGRLSRRIMETAGSLAADCAAASMRDRAYADGRVLVLERAMAASMEAQAGDTEVKVQTAKAEAIAAASEDASGQDKVVEKRLIYRIANDFNKHNSAGSAHPGTLAVSGLGPPLVQLPVPEDVQDILDDYIDILSPI